MTDLEIFEKVKSIICEEISIDEEKIQENSSLKDDLGADSLDAVEIIMQLEDAFGIQISDEAAVNMTTIKDIVDYIASNTK